MCFFTKTLFFTGHESWFDKLCITFSLSLCSLIQSYSMWSTVWFPPSHGHSGDSICTYMHSYVHTYIDTYIHTHTHTHTLVPTYIRAGVCMISISISCCSVLQYFVFWQLSTNVSVDPAGRDRQYVSPECWHPVQATRRHNHLQGNPRP
jgi:hypothetical protein